MPKLSNEKKCEALKTWLAENYISYKENFFCRRAGVAADIYIPTLRIVVRIGDDNIFYSKVCRHYFPIFIRENDTKAFVIEKMKNTIIKSMTNRQASLNSKKQSHE